MRIWIKPLSVNEAWQGRRFKTPKYRQYERDMWFLLPNANIPSGKLKINLTVAYSNKNADIDNFVKPFLDIMQKKYIFNDRMIYELNLKKRNVKKGDEYIEFEILPVDKITSS